MCKTLLPLGFIMALLIAWQLLSPLLPPYILPGPLAIAGEFAEQFVLMAGHARSTLLAAFLGVVIAVMLAVFFAVLMDGIELFRRMFYPIVVVSQAIPLIAVAPLFVIWFGFGMLPKLLAVVLICFFPIVVNLLKSFSSLDKNYLDLMRSMGAGKLDLYRHVKFPGSLPVFFAGLRIAATYSITGAVIGEWLGGSAGLGVYLIRSQKAFATSRVFAAILMIALLTGFFFLVVLALEGLLVPRKKSFIESNEITE